MMRHFTLRGMIAAAALFPFLLAAGCHSYHIDSTIENHTGTVIKLLEVDYPNASFGTDAVAAGADYHYRFQVEDDGPVKITYTAPNNHVVHITGVNLARRQQGRLQIVLLPNGKAEFHPELTAP